MFPFGRLVSGGLWPLRSAMRCRQYAAMAKKKFAVNLRYKEGRQLALEHFDFYYKPIFRHGWPSIRLGLTSRSKSCCIVNNFASIYSTMVSKFADEGGIDLLPLLEEHRRRREKKATGKTTYDQHQLDEDVDSESTAEAVNTEEPIDPRSAATLNEYIAPTKFITRDTTPQWLDDDAGPLIDTWSPKDLQHLPGDDIVYPKHLRVFVRAAGDITTFEDSVLDPALAVRSHQIIDAAMLFPIFALDVRPGEVVLDMCSSPGEKTTALLQTLVPCQLVCNDVVPARINLLKHNLCTYIQKDHLRDSVRFSRVDAKNLGASEIGVYDKVLVDVPSTEDRKSLRSRDGAGNLFRRIMASERMQLPEIQTEILVGGLKAVKRGGCLVYTTSTLSPSQNDEVIETALRKLNGDPDVDVEFAVCDLQGMVDDFTSTRVLRFARRHCRYGQLVIPNLANNYGPVYTCKLKRLV